MGRMQGWTGQCTTLLAYSIFAIGVGSYDAYKHEHEGGSMHTGVRQPLHNESTTIACTDQLRVVFVSSGSRPCASRCRSS